MAPWFQRIYIIVEVKKQFFAEKAFLISFMAWTHTEPYPISNCTTQIHIEETNWNMIKKYKCSYLCKADKDKSLNRWIRVYLGYSNKLLKHFGGSNVLNICAVSLIIYNLFFFSFRKTKLLMEIFHCKRKKATNTIRAALAWRRSLASYTVPQIKATP